MTLHELTTSEKADIARLCRVNRFGLYVMVAILLVWSFFAPSSIDIARLEKLIKSCHEVSK